MVRLRYLVVEVHGMSRPFRLRVPLGVNRCRVSNIALLFSGLTDIRQVEYQSSSASSCLDSHERTVSAKMFQEVVVLFLCVKLAVCCNFNVEDSRARCTSFEELSTAENKPQWVKLNVVPNGNAKFVSVKKDSFLGIPQLADLQVKGIANRIEPGAFNGLNKLYELHLDDNKMHQIQGRTFENLPIEVIYIYNCELQDILPRAFENMPKLRHAWITGNSISTIRQGVFTDLDIQFLYLRNNKIERVESDAFTGMTKLDFLSLEENHLTAFDPQLTIGFRPSLKRLYINRNQLSTINRGMFAVVPNLDVLLININIIETLGERSFNDLNKLWLLDMSHNQIEEVRPDLFRANNNNLQRLFLHDNKLSFVSSGVLVRLPNLKTISSTGNPWQCPCLEHFREWLFNNNVTRICDGEVKNGERPSCVVHPREFKDCVYDLENSRDAVKYYEEEIKKYPKLPPVCNTDGEVNPFLGA